MLTISYTKQIGLLGQFYCFIVTKEMLFCSKTLSNQIYNTQPNMSFSLVLKRFCIYKVIQLNIKFLQTYHIPNNVGNPILLVEYYNIF